MSKVEEAIATPRAANPPKGNGLVIHASVHSIRRRIASALKLIGRSLIKPSVKNVQRPQLTTSSGDVEQMSNRSK